MVHYSSSIRQTVSVALYKTFAWMFLGLVVTSLTAVSLYSSSYVYKIASSSSALIALLVAQLVCGVVLSSFFRKMSYSLNVGLFLGYCFLGGITLSPIALVYTIPSLFFVLALTAGLFAVLALYGALTKHDLSPGAIIAIGFLWGMLACSFLNFFIRSHIFDMGISFVGVLVFSFLTAFDVQRIKTFLSENAHDSDSQSRLPILGAFCLYLDFINLFLHLIFF